MGEGRSSIDGLSSLAVSVTKMHITHTSACAQSKAEVQPGILTYTQPHLPVNTPTHRHNLKQRNTHSAVQHFRKYGLLSLSETLMKGLISVMSACTVKARRPYPVHLLVQQDTFCTLVRFRSETLERTRRAVSICLHS